MEQQLTHFITEAKANFPFLADFVLNIAAALAVFIFGYLLARWLKGKIRGTDFAHGPVDNTLRPVIASILFYLILAISLYAALRQLGVEATGLLAVFGAAGLAIGLALKDTLGNIAAGFMLLILRPLSVGDYIETPNVAGTVIEVGLFTTTIKNVEGIFIYVPNGQIWSSQIRNYGRHKQRKLIVNLRIPFDADIDQARAVLVTAMEADPAMLQNPESPVVYLSDINDTAVILSARVWMKSDDWLNDSSRMRQNLKTALDGAGIALALPQQFLTVRQQMDAE